MLFRHHSEIKYVLFLDHYDCLVAADSIGNIMFFGINSTKLKNKLLCSKQYETMSAINSLEKFPIKCINFHSKRAQLIFGDEFGNVTIWDVSKLLIKLNQFHIDEWKGTKYKHYILESDIKPKS